jgi:hypothetical protein
MQTSPTLSELLKSEQDQLEKLRALDFDLLYASAEDTPSIKNEIDATVDEIFRLVREIRDCKLGCSTGI